jgi:hypothetical protein
MKVTMTVDKLIAEFGGAAEMARYFTSLGCPINRTTIVMWKARGQITMGPWLHMSVCLQMKTGRKLNLWDYIEVTP